MRRFLLIGVLAVTVTAAVAATAGAGDQRTPAGGGVSVVLPAGWHLTHAKGTPVTEPIPRLSAATFAVRWSARRCVCDTPRVANLHRDGAFPFVRGYPVISARERAATPERPAHFRIGGSPVNGVNCTPSDTVLFSRGRPGLPGRDLPRPRRPGLSARSDRRHPPQLGDALRGGVSSGGC